MARVTIRQLELALQQKKGNVAAVARELGVSRSTVYRHIQGSARLQQVLGDAREEMVDVAESALYKAVLDGNIAAIIFTLKTQGKARGYVERQEIAGAGGGPLSIQVTWPEDDGADIE